MDNKTIGFTSEPKDIGETFMALLSLGIQLAIALVVVSLFYKGMVSGSPVMVLSTIAISVIFATISAKMTESLELEYGVPALMKNISCAFTCFFCVYPALFLAVFLIGVLVVIFAA